MATRNAKTQRLEAFTGVQRKLVRDLQAFDTPALGPDFADLGGADLADALVVHRLVKHFSTAGEVDKTSRRNGTIRSMIEYDRQGLTTFDYRKLPQPFRGHALKARSSLHSFFKGMKRGRRFRAPSGETALSARGEVDLMFKLADPQQWRVSLEAAREAAAIGFSNVQLKRLIKQRFKEEYPLDWRRRCDAWYRESCGQNKVHRGLYVFQRMFLSCCVIQNYSRLSTVPKNAAVDRPISMEPLWNMICQLSYAHDMRMHLLSQMGIDLRSRAQLHRTLIRHAEKATVDFSNASNSNWLVVLRFLLPPKVFSKLCELRTPVCEFKGRFHHYNMLAPMGCGFTFEVMTIVLLHLARVLDPGATVFGDDVIIEANVAGEFMELCKLLGWVVNTSKTFVEGNFRESCGGFHDLSTKTDLVSYEMHEIEDDFDACTTCNKLYRIVEARQTSQALREVLWGSYCSLIELLPHDVQRRVSEVGASPIPDGVVLVPDDWEVDRDTSAIGNFIRTALQGQHRLARHFCYIPTLLEPRGSPQVHMASYMFRGSGYTPSLRGADKLVKQTVIADHNGALASAPLFTFI